MSASPQSASLDRAAARKRPSETCLTAQPTHDELLHFFQLIGEVLTSREISARLHLVATTVDSYRARIKQKLALKNAAELYQRAALWVAAPGA